VMNRVEAGRLLSRLQHEYEQLRQVWEQAKKDIESAHSLDSTTTPPCGSAEGSTIASADEIAIFLPGVRAYVRFELGLAQNLTKLLQTREPDVVLGVLEYGALKPCDDGYPDHWRHEPLESLAFDKLSNVWRLPEAGDPMRFQIAGNDSNDAFAVLHLRTLVKILDRILKLPGQPPA